MRFEEAYEGWSEGRLTQAAAAQILGVCERSFRRYLSRYEAEGLEGLIDRLWSTSRTGEPRSMKCGCNGTVSKLAQRLERQTLSQLVQTRRRHAGYTWVKKHLQERSWWPRPRSAAPIANAGSDRRCRG